MASQCFLERPAGRERDAPVAAFAEGTTLQKSVRNVQSGGRGRRRTKPSSSGLGRVEESDARAEEGDARAGLFAAKTVLALSAVLLNLLFLPLALSRLRLFFVSAALFSRLPHSPQAEKEEPQAGYGGAAYESKSLPAGTGTRIAANRDLVYLLIVNDSVNSNESEPEGSCQQHRRHDGVTSIHIPHQGKAAYDGSDDERRRPEGNGIDTGKSGARRHESGNAG